MVVRIQLGVKINLSNWFVRFAFAWNKYESKDINYIKRKSFSSLTGVVTQLAYISFNKTVISWDCCFKKELNHST